MRNVSGSAPPLPWGKGRGEGVRSIVRAKPLTRIASCDAIRPLPMGEVVGLAFIDSIFISDPLARGDQRPQIIGAARGDALAEFHGPVTLMAEIVAPGQRPHGVAMQDVFERIADRTMHLMGDRRAF